MWQPAFRFPFGGTDKGVSSCLQFDDNPDEGDEDSYQAEQEEASEVRG